VPRPWAFRLRNSASSGRRCSEGMRRQAERGNPPRAEKAAMESGVPRRGSCMQRTRQAAGGCVLRRSGREWGIGTGYLLCGRALLRNLP